MHTHREQIEAYITKDGSSIRELMHPELHGNSNQSLAEATVPPGVVTALHQHMHTEELYYILQGTGEMTLGERSFSVTSGDTIYIPPNTPHQIFNPDQIDLIFLCACCPPYTHNDTKLLEQSLL